jgi:hypothetical protein
MSDEELRKFGEAAKYMVSPRANMGKPPREVFVIQLEEARVDKKTSEKMTEERRARLQSFRRRLLRYDSAARQFHQQVVADFVLGHGCGILSTPCRESVQESNRFVRERVQT